MLPFPQKNSQFWINNAIFWSICPILTGLPSKFVSWWTASCKSLSLMCFCGVFDSNIKPNFNSLLKFHQMRNVMVKKYFHKANILLNKLLQWNDLSQKCSVVKLGGHKLVQHVCSIGNSRPIRPKHPPHVAPTYDPNSLKSMFFLTN